MLIIYLFDEIGVLRSLNREIDVSSSVSKQIIMPHA